MKTEPRHKRAMFMMRKGAGAKVGAKEKSSESGTREPSGSAPTSIQRAHFGKGLMGSVSAKRVAARVPGGKKKSGFGDGET